MSDETARRQRELYAANPEPRKVSNRAQYAKHSAARKLASKAYRLATLDVKRAHDREYSNANTERRKVANCAYYAAKRAEIRARHAVYRETHRTEAKAAGIARYNQNKLASFERSARRRALKRATHVEAIDFAKVLAAANGLCGICRQPFDLFGVHFDHIVPLAKGGTHTADNIQATHARCNLVKGAKVG